MNKKIVILLFLLSCVMPLAAQEVTLVQIMQLHRRAIGGIDAITSYVTARLNYTLGGEGARAGTMEADFGEEYLYREIIRSGERWRSRSFDGDAAYQFNAAAHLVSSAHHINGSPRDVYQFQSVRDGASLFPLMSAERFGARLSLQKWERSGSIVQADYPDGAQRTFVLSPQMLVTSDRLSVKTADLALTITREYEDYRSWDGAFLPTRTTVTEEGRISIGGENIPIKRSFTLTLTTAEGNVEFDAGFFTPGLPSSVADGTVLKIGPLSFRARPDVPTGFEPHVARAARIRESGSVDLVSGEIGGISIHTGDGAGAFPTRHRLPCVTGAVTAMAVADFDRDGRDDVAIAARTRSSGSLLVLRGAGSGQFAAQPALAGPTQPTALRAADVDGDGAEDLVLVNGGDHSAVLVYWGDGKGGFSEPLSLPLTGSGEGVAIADLNGDGQADLLAVDRQKLMIFRASGARGFAAAEQLDAGPMPWCLTVADVTGDSSPDVIVGNGGESSDSDIRDVAVLVGNGDGSFQPARFASGGAGIVAVAWADFDGNGSGELAALSNATHEVWLFSMIESGLVPLGALPCSLSPVDLTATDLDADGLADLVITDEAGDTLTVWSAVRSAAGDR